MRKQARKAAKACLLRTLGSGVVLEYHRVADVQRDPQRLAVSPRNFAEHLEVLRQSYVPVRLLELRHRAGWLASRSHPVALTFDDGYVDNLVRVLPGLQATGIPATVFVIAGQLGSREEFWWDELERIFLATPELPESLELTIGSKELSWSLPRDFRESDPHWHMYDDQPLSPRQAVYTELSSLVRLLSTAARERVLGSLRRWAGLTGAGRSYNRVLTGEEVAELTSDGLVEVGAHTMNHPRLSSQPIAVQKEEIGASRRRLEEILNAEVLSFAYPYGGREDYTSATVRLVKQAGYECACSNFFGRVYRVTDPFRIPRLVVHDWNGDEFARRLGAIFTP